MAVGPVQLIVLGFAHPDFHGEVIAELERLRKSDTVRVIDALAVYKDAAGELEVEHLSNLTEEEAIELGSKVGALIGIGIEGESGAEDLAPDGTACVPSTLVGPSRGLRWHPAGSAATPSPQELLAQTIRCRLSSPARQSSPSRWLCSPAALLRASRTSRGTRACSSAVDPARRSTGTCSRSGSGRWIESRRRTPSRLAG